MLGTRAVSPAILVTRESTRQTYAKEKLKFIADVSYLISIRHIKLTVSKSGCILIILCII